MVPSIKQTLSPGQVRAAADTAPPTPATTVAVPSLPQYWLEAVNLEPRFYHNLFDFRVCGFLI